VKHLNPRQGITIREPAVSVVIPVGPGRGYELNLCSAKFTSFFHSGDIL
jgi:hypothetical protein